MAALDKQVGGSHYKKLEMQPIQVTYFVSGSPLFGKVAKYLTRSKGGKLVNYKKALHCVELEKELIDLRIANYRVHVHGYEGPDLWNFANQFESPDTIAEILHCMLDGYLSTATDLINVLIADHKNGEITVTRYRNRPDEGGCVEDVGQQRGAESA